LSNNLKCSPGAHSANLQERFTLVTYIDAEEAVEISMFTKSLKVHSRPTIWKRAFTRSEEEFHWIQLRIFSPFFCCQSF
jgi:hypothetical protein